MKKLNNNKFGFSAVEILLVIVLVGLVGFVGWYVIKQSSDNEQQNKAISTSKASESKAKSEETIKKIKSEVIEPVVGSSDLDKKDEANSDDKADRDINGTYVSTVTADKLVNIKTMGALESTKDKVDSTQNVTVAIVQPRPTGELYFNAASTNEGLTEEFANKYVGHEFKQCAYVKAQGKEGIINLLSSRADALVYGSFSVASDKYKIVCTPFSKLTATPTSNWYGEKYVVANVYNAGSVSINVAWIKIIVK